MGLENLRNEAEVKSPERRKAKKPLIEKQRRRRINESLNELKILVLQALNKDPSLYSKMEKADILDLTVNYLKSVKCEQGFFRDATSLAKYRAGYNDCAGEMTRYLMSDTGLDYHNRAKLLSQVASSCQNANLRTTADMNTRPPPQAQFYMRPMVTPIGTATTACPAIASSRSIFPTNYGASENKLPLSFSSPSMTSRPVEQLSSNFSPYLMTSSAINSFRAVGSNVWRPW